MDITRIRDYIDYKPVLNQTSEQFFESVIQKAMYLSANEKQQVRNAFLYAQKFHGDGMRLSGEQYIIHPIKVMEFLLELSPDVISLQVALLHDVIEDTPATYEDVCEQFGQEVADLCVGLEKVAKVKWRGEERSIESLKKMFLAMGQDLRVIFIKLADRVHNIQTLHYHPKKEKRIRIAEETLKVYVPIAKRLGLYVFQGLLENGAFYQLEPREFTRISFWLERNYGDIDRYKDEGIVTLKTICAEDGVEPLSVLGRLKSPWRIWTKLQKYNTQDISKVMDIVAFRIITGSITDCYSDLGVIHKHFTPIFAKMKDYIALPKPNNYKSLHTTVLGMFKFPVEIQIRTEEMDRVANFGVAAHFAYAESRKAVSVSENQAAWIEKLQNLVEKYQDGDEKENFKHELDIEILQKNIFVYTPKGDVLELPAESTVLDFAFRVHSDVGLKFKNALVNGKIVPIDRRVKTGDIVDIQTFKNKYTASKSWMQRLHTPSARSKLTKYLRHLEKEDISTEMSVVINAKLQEFGLPLLGTKDDKIVKMFPGDQRDQQMLKLRDRQISLTRFLRNVYGSLLIPEKPLSQSSDRNVVEALHSTLGEIKKPLDKSIVVDGDKYFSVLICPECEPKLGSRIIGRSGKDGIKIHDLSCGALTTVNPQKLLEAHRSGQEENTYIVHITLDMKDQPGILLELLKIIEQFHINVDSLTTATQAHNGFKNVEVRLLLGNPSKLVYVLKELAERKTLCRSLQYTFE